MKTEVQGRLTPEQLIAEIDQGRIDTVISAICDMQGRLVGKRVSGWYFRDHVMSHGTHFCTYLLGNDVEMNTPDGFDLMNWDTGYGDFLARLDWSAARTIPWLESTALVLADAVVPATNELVPVAPRTVLSNQIERLHQAGFAAKMAVELEFYLFDQSYEEAKLTNYAELKPSGWYSEDYHLLQGTKHESFYRQVRNLMISADVPIEFSKGEDSGGQHEINIHYSDPLESADRAVLLKHGMKEIAFQHGKAVSFMPKLNETWTGSSGHIHLSLWDESGSRALFADSDGSDSEVMHWFLGGLISNTRDLALLFAPTINSYKRFAPGSWAPVNILWARDNRTAGFRVVGEDSSLRIENRFPGSDANPYLSLAAMIAAGLHGIEHHIEPPAEFHGNGYHAADAPRVPASLQEAAACWETSAMVREAFGEAVHRHYLNSARVEQAAFDKAVTDWELNRYFERW